MTGDADARWMGEACAEARRGLGRTAPNPAVGCVIVKSGRLVGKGYHRRAGAPHAEVEALASAGRRAAGATAYVTLEPCCHHGRTPPCTDALVAAGVTAVVVGCKDPNPEVAGKGLRRLRQAGLRAAVGVRKEECEDLIRGFRCWVTEARPWVHVKLAASLDARIAARGGASKWISSPASRKLVQAMRARSDAILVGVGTVLADDPRLTCRQARSRNPLRVVLDSRLRTPADARVVTGPGRCLLVCAKGAPAAARRRLEAAGAEVVEAAPHRRRGWQRLLAELGRREVLELLVEGGSEVATAAITADVVNAMTIFYNPRLIGSDGVPLVGPLGVTTPQGARRLRTVEWSASGPDLVWTGVFE